MRTNVDVAARFDAGWLDEDPAVTHNTLGPAIGRRSSVPGNRPPLSIAALAAPHFLHYAPSGSRFVGILD